MTDTAHSEFYHARRVLSGRPGLARRVVRHYQLIELSLIIGGILLIWGAVSLGKIGVASQETPAELHMPAYFDVIVERLGLRK
jgi:hypothetical protein